MPEGGIAPVLIFDLDGTILRINSFPRWLLFLIGGRIPELSGGRRALLSLRTLSLLLPRKIGLVGHDRLARGVQRAWWYAAGDAGDQLAGGFQRQLLRRVRPNLQSLLDMVAMDHVDAVLATAACGDYATGFGQRLGFRHVLATPANRDSSTPQNLGSHKRDQVMAFLDGRGWAARPLILLTDHIDDLPLMRESRTVCWFGPEKNLHAARAAAGETSFIGCRSLSDEAVLVTLLAMIG